MLMLILQMVRHGKPKLWQSAMVLEHSQYKTVSKASALWANAFYKWKCPCVCVRLFVPVFTYEVPFQRLFAPPSQSRMSKNFRGSKSFGKSIGKKRSQIWKLLLIKGVKSQREKKSLFNGLFSLTSQNPMSKNFWNSWENVMERSGLRFKNFCS